MPYRFFVSKAQHPFPHPLKELLVAVGSPAQISEILGERASMHTASMPILIVWIFGYLGFTMIIALFLSYFS